MARSTFKRTPEVFVSQIRWPIPFSPKIALENAIDATHVPYVHGDTVKSCQTLIAMGSSAALLYEFYPIPWLKFWSKKYLALRIVRSERRQAHWVFFPVSTHLVTALTVKATSTAPDESAGEVEHTFQMRLSWLLRPLAPLILYLRNLAENKRWAQDMELMTARANAIKAGHKDDPTCIARPELLAEWFRLES